MPNHDQAYVYYCMMLREFLSVNLIAVYLCCFLIIQSCSDGSRSVEIPTANKSGYGNDFSPLNSDDYYDKVLGAIVGSAIGDAMGASTEMWHRSQIQEEYGYITGLTTATRERSPEGTWGHNLDGGSTTDDTRWKLLMSDYFHKYGNDLNAKSFSQYISTYYNGLAEQLSAKAREGTDALDMQMEKLNWIKEWQRVAQAHLSSPQEYQQALARFYGGEMSCAGMLYSPMFGLVTNNPDSAYVTAFDHASFDIGYAKDITAMVAAMTNVAMLSSDIDSILSTIDFVDPLSYRNSRLISRLSLSLAKTADQYVADAKNLDLNKIEDQKIPTNYPYVKEDWIRQEYIYEQLESSQMPIAFHSGEIWQILYTALEFGEGDFIKTMQFIVNYGRDNDTVAAVAGMILGASAGFEKLPNDLKNQVLQVNKDQMGIDLRKVAGKLTQRG